MLLLPFDVRLKSASACFSILSVLSIILGFPATDACCGGPSRNNTSIFPVLHTGFPEPLGMWNSRKLIPDLRIPKSDGEFPRTLSDRPSEEPNVNRSETIVNILKPLPKDDSDLAFSGKKTQQSKTAGTSPLFEPNLSGGAVYRTTRDEQDSRLTMDFLLPAKFDRSFSLFLESRAEYQNVLSNLWNSADQRFDLGVGLGWRKVWPGVMFGTNAFWDTSRLSADWYGSPGIGIEFAAHGRNLVWDAILNFYRGGGIDLAGGFTFPILEDRLDMRLHAGKYRFFDGEFILGSKCGVAVSSPDRFLSVSYEYGQDSRNPEFHSFACSLTVPFQLDRIFEGKNPVELPVPPGRGTRYSERLQSEGVKRAWRKPDTVVEARNTAQGERWTTPGKLTDTTLWETKQVVEEGNGADKPNTNSENSLGCALVTLLNTDVGKGLFAMWAAYLGCNYTYRNAFGPFKIEPYELERIKKEMPEKRQRKRAKAE